MRIRNRFGNVLGKDVMLKYIKLIHSAGNVISRSRVIPSRVFSSSNTKIRKEAKIVEINEVNSGKARKSISKIKQ